MNTTTQNHETHSCEHAHHAHHGHVHNISTDGDGRLKRAFKIGIWLNAGYVVLEALFGFMSDSMGLLSDAGHNLSDIFSLLVALVAFKVSKNKPTERFTYGFRRATVNASVVNAIILYVAVIFILVESVRKLFHPSDVEGDLVAWVAAAGVLINGITAWLFMKDSHGDLNVRGAFLHMAADALVSVGVVISGIVIMCTGWTLIDPIVLAYGSYGMLRESICLAFDGVPQGVDPIKVMSAISGIDGVVDVHHLHIWGISTTEVAMTVHVIVDDGASVDRVICDVRHLASGMGISHSTIEAETSENDCNSCSCG